MKLETATAIAAAADESGLDVQVREGYSGRGMGGKGTTALVYDSETDLRRSIAVAAVRVSEDQGAVDQTQTLDDFLEDLDFERDQMGRGWIVY